MVSILVIVAVAAIGLSAHNISAQNPIPYPCVAAGGDATAGSWHCISTYDAGLTGDAKVLRAECGTFGGIPCTLAFGDGNLDVGGVIYDGCYSMYHNGNALPASDKSVNRDWPHCFPPNSAWSLARVYLTDDSFGSDIGGSYCINLKADEVCRLDTEGELNPPGCWTPVFGGRPDAVPLVEEGHDCGVHGVYYGSFCGDVSFHVPNYMFALVVYVDGPIYQPVDCPGTANPMGGTTGTVNIWITPTAPPQCSDGIDNDGDGYVDWGYGPNWPEFGDFFAGQVGDGCHGMSFNSE